MAAVAALVCAPATPGAEPRKPDGLAVVRTHDVAVREGLAYLGQTAGLQVLDVTDASAPRRAGRLDLPATIHGVTLEGGRAYLAAGGHGLYIVDIEEPATPLLVARFDRPGSVRQVLAHGGYLFLAEHRHGLGILDISEPTRPRQVASISTRGELDAIALVDGILATAEGQAGSRLFDVTRPRTPHRIAVLDESEQIGDVAFGATGLLLVAAGRAGLLAYTPIGGDAKRSGSWPEAAPAYSVTAHGALALVSRGGRGLLLVDTSSPADGRARARPVEAVRSYPVGRVTVWQQLAFCALERYELAVVDLGDPTEPRVLFPRARSLRIRFP